MFKTKFQVRVTAPPDEDPNHHCSVSEAGGDSPRSEENSPKNVTSSRRLGGLKLAVPKLSSIKSGTPMFFRSKGSKSSVSSASDPASDPAAKLTEANLQGHGGRLVQYEPSMVSGGGGSSQAKKTMITAASHTHYSSHYSSAPTGLSSASYEYKSESSGGTRQRNRATMREYPPGEEVFSPRLWPPPLPDQKIGIGRRKLAAGSGLLFFWSLIVTGALFCYIWRYFIVEVDDMQGFAAAAAMQEVQVRTEALLAPAFSVARIFSLATKMGSSPLEYQVLNKLLVSQLQASPVLTEIHLADASGGSVLVQPGTVHVDTLPLSQRSLLFRSDRGNCNDVARSCALQPMKANSSDWYARGAEVESSKDEFSEDGKEERAFTLPVTWHGPSFLKFSSYATAWAVYHWNPAYSLVTKLGWMSSTVLRVVLNANGLRDVVKEAEESTQGKVYICTESGEVLAASDMSHAVQVDMDTGSVKFRRVWEMEQSWASMVSEDVIRSSEAQDFLWGWVIGNRVFVRPFEMTGSQTFNMGLKLRVILAVPRSAMALQWLEILSPVCALFGMLPHVTLLSYVFVKWVQRTRQRLAAKRERRRLEYLKEKEMAAKMKAERMGKVKGAGQGQAKAKAGKGKKKAKK